MKNVLRFFVLTLFCIPNKSNAQVDQSIQYSSYFGGSDMEFCGFHNIDTRNDKWLLGSFSLSNDMPLIGNSYQGSPNGNMDGFISLFDESGGLLHSSYLGGSEYDAISSARFASEGMGYVVSGATKSADFPVSPSVHLEEYQGERDGFISRFDEEGELIWSTLFGGSENDEIEDMAIDAAGFVYIVGRTFSSDLGTEGVHQTNYVNGFDAFIAKFDQTGNLVWSSYFGDEGSDIFWAVDLSPDGTKVYCSGYTTSGENIASNGWQNVLGGVGDGLIACFNSNDGSLNWSSYYGGGEIDECRDVSVSSGGQIYISGRTQSSSAISSVGSHQESIGGGVDNFLACFDSDGGRVWGTYFGGDEDEGNITGLTIQNGDIVLQGFSDSQNNIAFGNPLDGGSADGSTYLAKFDENGLIIWGTYFLSDRAVGILSLKAIPGSNKMIGISSISSLIDMSDIISEDAYQSENAGSTDLIFFVLGDNTVSVDEYSVKPLKVYPNPANQNVFIEIPENKNGIFSLEIFDAMGKTVMHKTSSGGAYQLDISKLSPGAYILNAQSESDLYRSKLIIE